MQWREENGGREMRTRPSRFVRRGRGGGGDWEYLPGGRGMSVASRGGASGKRCR